MKETEHLNELFRSVVVEKELNKTKEHQARVRYLSSSSKQVKLTK
jgi:hypothetical protein